MQEMFALYLRSGLFGSVMIAVILLLRVCLKRAPRKYICILWMLVAIRLLLPFHLESRLSLQPHYDSFEIVDTVPEQNITPQTPPQWTPVEPDEAAPGPSEPVQDTSVSLDPAQVIRGVWLGVGGTLLLYTLASYGYLKYKVKDAVKYDGRIMESGKIQGAFLLGYFNAKIYLPVGLSERDRDFIIAHERAHISRGDNWWKLVGFLCTCVHWYNPLVWIGYVLLCRDIEVACDEYVIQNLDLDDRKAYSFALLNCGKRLSGIVTCPVAFGEISLKQRIKNVLSYRRSGLWLSVVAVVLMVFVAVCFLTTPMTGQQEQPDETLPTEETTATKPTMEDTTITEPTAEETTETDPTEKDHIYDDGVVTVEASCGVPGVRSYTCTVCGEVKTESIPALSHAYDGGVQIHDPNCREAGTLMYTCKNCGDTKTENIDTLEHNFGEPTVTKAATCKDTGEISVICTLCGFRQVVETTPRTDTHSYQNRVIRKPTCADRGEGENVCTLCGYSTACQYDLTEHTYGAGVITKEASCSEKGEILYTCSVCGAAHTQSTPTKEHTWLGGTCTYPATCGVCGQTDSKAMGHDYVLVNEHQASKGFVGFNTYRCSRCDDSITEYFGLTGAYDFEAIKAAGRERAKELGMKLAPADYEVHSGVERTFHIYYVSLEHIGGQSALVQEAIRQVEYLYENLMDEGIDPSTCYMVITVKCAFGTDGGMFFINVSA